MLSKIDYNMIIKVQKRYRILEKQVREIEKNIQNIHSEFREIDEYISDNLQNAFLENIYRDNKLSPMSKLSDERPFTTDMEDDLMEMTDKEVSSDKEVFLSSDDLSSDKQSDDLSTDDLSTDDLSSDDDESTNYSYTKTYSAQLQYPIQDLAMNVADYVDSNPDFTEVTFIYCAFSINKDNIVPFVLYSVDINNDIVSFPSMRANTTDDINKYVTDGIKDGTFVGYIPDTSTIYLFYNLPTLPSKRATINELYHLKSVDEIPVDESIIALFAQNKQLIHILDLETDEQIDIPFSGYLCGLDDKNAVINIDENEEDDIPLFTDDIFGIGLEGDFYYLTTHKLDVSRSEDAQRYAIFPLDGINFDKTVQDYSEYNSVYYKSDKYDFWAITSVKQIGKI